MFSKYKEINGTSVSQKCFTSLKHLREEKSVCLGMESMDGEFLKFKEPIQYNNEGVENLLNEVEKRMKSSLLDNILTSY